MIFIRKGKLHAFASTPLYALALLPYFLLDESRQDFYLSCLILLSFGLSLSFFLRYRAIADSVPLRLSSASQGYVQLIGEGYPSIENDAGPGPSTLPAGLWFNTAQREYSAPFEFKDDTGICTIDPSQAEIITARTDFYEEMWYEALYPGETLYVVGELTSLHYHDTQLTHSHAVNQILSHWKQDKAFMLRMFDKNQDGVIDMDEWEAVRNQAEHHAKQYQEDAPKQAATHSIQKPGFGYPFIISNIHPDDLVIRYQRAMWAHSMLWMTLLVSILTIA